MGMNGAFCWSGEHDDDIPALEVTEEMDEKEVIDAIEPLAARDLFGRNGLKVHTDSGRSSNMSR